MPGLWRGELRAGAGKKCCELVVGAGRYFHDRLGLACEFDGVRVGDIKLCLVQANIIANLPGEERVLLGRIVPNEKNRRCSVEVSHRGRRVGPTAQGGRKCRQI